MLPPSPRCGSFNLPAAVTAPAAAVPTATRSALGLRTGFVDVQGSAVEVPTVESADCGISFRIDAHFNKGEASGLPGVAIRHNIDAIDGAIRIKHGTKRIFRRPETEVTYKNIFHRFFLNLPSSESSMIGQRADKPNDEGRCENRRNFKDTPSLARVGAWDRDWGLGTGDWGLARGTRLGGAYVCARSRFFIELAEIYGEMLGSG